MTLPLGYDAKGNLTSGNIAGAGAWTFGYDAENRLLTADKTSGGTVHATYTYDPLGRRTKKSGTGVTTTYFLSDGTDEVAEYDSSGNLTAINVPGPAIDQPIAVVTGSAAPYTHHYFHTNRQDSVIAMSDDSGAKVEGPYVYDPYGNCFSGGSGCSSSGEPYRFTGRRFDPETGLLYYRARYYWPQGGRFLQTDPVGYDADLNLYAYVGNDPTDKTDPSGNCVEDACVVEGGVVVSAGVVYGVAAGLVAVGVCVQACGSIMHSIENAASGILHNEPAKPTTQAPGSRPGKPFTPKGKEAVREGNRDAHGGQQTCEECGRETTPAQQGQKGVTPPGTQTEVDHVDPKSNGGSGTPENGQVLCRDCNQAKGSRTPQQQPSQPQQNNMQSSSACDKNGICGVP